MIFKLLLILAKEVLFYEPPPGLRSVPILFLCTIYYDSTFQAFPLLLTKNSAAVYTISAFGKSTGMVTCGNHIYCNPCSGPLQKLIQFNAL